MMKSKAKKSVLFILSLFICLSLTAENVTSDYCSFKIPSNMEMQEGVLSDISGSMSYGGDALYEAVLQQKGLNSTTESYEGYVANADAYNDYCRITISCKDGTGGLGVLSTEEIDYLDDYMYDMMASIYAIPQWNGISAISFKGYPAYILDYVRGSVTGDEDVHVYNMIVSTETHDWTIVFAARKSNLSKWIPSFREFGESFEFGYMETVTPQDNSAINTYNIPGTSQRFNWYRTPKWESEYTDGISFNAFYDENYDSDGYININISVMDLTGSISGKFGQLGFLFGVQQQMPLTITELMDGIHVRVKENSIDSEHNIYTYHYSYTIAGMSAEGIVLYSFSGTKCIVFTAEWEDGHPMVENIVDDYIESIK